MKLGRLHIDGFGGLVDCDVCFDAALNVVVGPNEAGKSTLSAAVLALLYGYSRGAKDAWRPWSGARYAAMLQYTLADGRAFEVRREFERDAKGVRVYDSHGNDASPECAVGKIVVPGHAHLGIPLEVFVNSSFLAQSDVAIDGMRAERIAHALARALDGGPKEDAALGALKRLDDAVALHVGKKRATINAPLRKLWAEISEAQMRAEEMRARLVALDSARAHVDTETQRSQALAAALREHERRGRALRAFTLRSRLAALREIRDDLAALQAERARYDDVEHFESASVPEFEERYHAWITACAIARAHAAEAERAPTPSPPGAELTGDELAALDDAAFARLADAAAAAAEARRGATLAAESAQSRDPAPLGAGFVHAPVAAGVAAAASAAGLSAAHDLLLALASAALALVCFGVGFFRSAARRAAGAEAESARGRARAAAAGAADAEAQLAVMLTPFRAASFDELALRRARARELAGLRAEAERLARQTREAHERAAAAGLHLDASTERLVPGHAGIQGAEDARAAALGAIKVRERRKRTRDGLDVRLSMLAMRRGDVLGSDDEFALEAEFEDLTAAGVEAGQPGEVSARALEAERRDLERRATDSRAAASAGAAELRSAEAQIGDLAALDERVLELRERAERLERFEAAVALARSTIEDRTRETHQRFAYRLADYASQTMARVTDDKYLDVRVDPATLAVRVRVPQTGDIVGVDRLSAGTRVQAYLVVRLAMVRMLSEGLEPAPLLLDDPFAYWDDARIASGLPILQAAAREVQVVLFSTSELLAREAAAQGAHVIDLAGLATGPVVQRPAV